MKYWLIKSEPSVYSWDQLVADGRTLWDGVRNYQARNNLKAMSVDDIALYYHSNEGLAIVGTAKVVREAYPDPTIDDDTWVAVDIVPLSAFPEPVTLAKIKQEPTLQSMALLKQGRLSVVPVTSEEYECILALSKS
ncbi:MAG TPA: EVE domain-containing protein [Candidatus Kapabacteria bacterium]|jgi:predicted RNA-binding protein with PUA-like domain|nr:EVE domain-containing protein [Ignavibacteria bacterium]HRI30576.1 EVE domain-containing protein [Candidatus Kapabacteria bacterium]HRK59384.1 EVE domain-containing protein [Candidatus Kapabacteria bacterium]